MRISQQDVRHLIQALSAHAIEPLSKLYLYGSRVHDHLKGGDIDLVLVVTNDEIKNRILSHRVSLLVDFKKGLGERRIDFNIVTRDFIKDDEFYQHALRDAVLLKEW